MDAKQVIEKAKEGAANPWKSGKGRSLGDIFTQGQVQPDFAFSGLPVGKLGILIGPPGAGKSFLCLQIALMVACGKEAPIGCSIGKIWQPESQNYEGQEIISALPFGRPIIYYNFEDDAVQTENRINHIVSAFCLDESGDINRAVRDAYDKNFHMQYLDGIAITLLQSRREIFEKSPVILGMIEHIKEVGAKIVFIDTLRQVIAGGEIDESVNSDMARIGQALSFIAKQADCAIFMVHHVNKAALGADMRKDSSEETDETSGAGGINAFVRWRSKVSNFPESLLKNGDVRYVESGSNIYQTIGKENRRQFVVYQVKKCNYIAPQPPCYFKRLKGGCLKPITLIDEQQVEKSARNYGIAKGIVSIEDDE